MKKNLLFFNKKGNQQNILWNGTFWEGRTLLPRVSQDLFEIEHIFTVEKLLDNSSNINYGIPHGDAPGTYGNILGISGKFTARSPIINLSDAISPELVGAYIFSSYVTGKILSISGNSITLDSNSSDTGEGDINICAWRARFETPYNIIDFDEIPTFFSSWKKGNTFLIVDDASKLVPNYIIVGQGIPDGTKIVSISRNIVNINKRLSNTSDNIKCWSYNIENSNDVSGRLYQYNLITDPTLDSPVILAQDEIYFPIDYSSEDILVSDSPSSGSVIMTPVINSSSITINIALNSDQEALIGRVLIIEDITTITPTLILRMELIGEVIGEDERLNLLLENFGRGFYKEDAAMLRASDPLEPYPDYTILNNKRKELLIQGSEIFPYIGSYKALINIINFFGYEDLRIKEYWLNIQKTSIKSQTPFQQNEKFLEKIKNTPHGESILIDNLLDDENSGKYKQVEIYGKKSDGSYGLKSSLEQIFPSTAFKKTPLFGLFYDINSLTGEEDEWGYPTTKDSFTFTPDEVLVKLFALKEKLKKDYLPLSAKIIDITGEGFYFSVNKQRVWSDSVKIDTINLGLEISASVTPSIGYIEDLRAFQIRTNSTLPQLPYVSGFEGNTDVSNFGNITNPNPYLQNYTPSESKSWITAIENYYSNLQTHGEINLGDGDYNGIGYQRFIDNSNYYLPAGFPTILENTSFDLSMDDLQTPWSTLDRNISEYTTTLPGVEDLPGYDGSILDIAFTQLIKVDNDFLAPLTITLPSGYSDIMPITGKLQLRLETDPDNFIVVEVQSYDDHTGITEVLVLYYRGSGSYTNWSVRITNVAPVAQEVTYYNYTQGADGFYSWDNIRFIGYYEIEWTISKSGTVPYFYQLRGAIKDYWKIPHILPYVGEYDVQCRVWNNVNDISIGYFNKIINVEERNIELKTIARFRESESYTWDNMVLPWDRYDSPWIFPIEQQLEQPQVVESILNYSRYGNKLNDGQECKVLSKVPETIASLNLNIGVIGYTISFITSNVGTGLGPATIYTTDPHGINPGDKVYIIDPDISGEYIISSSDSTSFVIPLIVPSPITPVSSYVIGPGKVSLSVNNRNYVTAEFNGSIGSTVGSLYSLLNSDLKDPHFSIISYSPTTVIGVPENIFLYNIVLQAPTGSGSRFNGQLIDFSSSGSIILNNNIDTTITTLISAPLSGGVNEYSDYIDYTPGDNLPTQEMKNWGSKQITWDSLNDITWDDLYSQTLDMYDYHSDWLGGFDLYNIRYGDQIKVGKNNPGIIIESSGSPVYPMPLYDVANQLNASNDPGISKFNYTVRGYSRIYGKYNSDGPLIVSEVIAPHITYSQSTVQMGTIPADFSNMTNGIFTEPISAVTTNDLSTEWIMADLNQTKRVTKIVIGCDLNSTVQGGAWDKTFAENRDVEYSLDGTAWNFLFNTGTFNQGIQEYSVSVDARYIRITATGSTRLVITEFYPMIPFSTEIGPMEESTKYFRSLGFSPTSIAKGNGGEIVMADGLNLHIFKSPTDIRTITLDYAGYYVQIDKQDRVWYYGVGEVPLQIIDLNSPEKRTAFIRNGNPPTFYPINIELPLISLMGLPGIRALAIDNRGGDFAIFVVSGFSRYLLYYDGSSQEFSVYDTSNGLPSMEIRQILFDYKNGIKTLWIATDSGISVFDGIKFVNYTVDNSGLFSNNIYSICIDEIDNKWIGTGIGLSYYDGETWGVWNNDNTPQMPTGFNFTNIINTGHGNIFFILRDSMADTYMLGYFNCDTFNFYTNNPGTNDQFTPIIEVEPYILGSMASYENVWLLLQDIKYMDGEYSQYPGNIFYLDNLYYLNQFDYIIPHINATSKLPGSQGWDFIYHSSSRSLPSLENYGQGIGTAIIDFNFIQGSINSDYILTDLFRPNFPLVDGYSWKCPDFTGYDFSGIIRNHPELNPDHLFLDAPLRDILDGSALKEEYWRNPPVERIANKKERSKIGNFEWLIKLGGANNDSGTKVTVGKDGYVYVTGYFKGDVFFGSPNSLNSGTFTTLSSPDCISIFVAKYNSVGIIQWARMYGETPGSVSPYDYDFTPTAIKLDNLNNVYVIGYKEKNRNNISDELQSNILVKWDWNGTFMLDTQLFTPSSDTALDENFDLGIDENNNLYIAGEFTGTLSSGDFSITSASDVKEIYVAKIEYDGYITYLNKLGTGIPEYSPSIVLGNQNDLYIAFSNYNLYEKEIKIRSYNSLDFSMYWEKSIHSNDLISISNNPPVLDMSGSGELIISMSFAGSLSIENITIDSLGDNDIALFKLLTTGNILWGKNIGSTYGDRVYSIKSDKENSIYILSSFTNEFFIDPLNPIERSIGLLDALLIKLDSNGVIIDEVELGSLTNDEAIGLSIDPDLNIFITGYLTGPISTGNYETSSPEGGSADIFIGKIPHQSFIPGRSMEGVISWMGTQSWGYGDKKIYDKEFEIPLGTTVFINPIGSYIPGKKGYKWKLIEGSTGTVIIDLKDVSYFIWNFKIPGYYDLSVELLDTNGNIYTTYKKGYIRVINHRDQFKKGIVPHQITSNDFKNQSIYQY